MHLSEILKTKETLIVDVRTPREFSNGNLEGSLNIPLQELPARIEVLRQMNHHLVVCCASGNRSSTDYQFMQQNGIKDCYDGGSWLDV